MNQEKSAFRVVVITGMSGAGKSLTLRVLEDAGYTAIDNIAPALLPAVAAHAASNSSRSLAVVTDARSGAGYSQLLDVLDEIRHGNADACLLFLDASDNVLVQRYKETRRPHPLFSPDDGVLTSIQAERAMLVEARAAADRLIDTSSLTVPELRALLDETFAASGLNAQRLTTTITTFGFKYGLPLDADLVFDVRFLRNPYWVAELKNLDGTSPDVRHYVSEDPNTAPLVTKIFDLIEFSLPQYQREGKVYLTIAIGCTGGQHRSVAVGEMLAELVRIKGYHVLVVHRDSGGAGTQELQP